MKAVVVYESMFGNTREIAEHIAEGLAASAVDVEVVHVSAATADVVRSADLLVVGGPTHVRSMTRQSTRKAAAEQAKTRNLVAEPTPSATGLREWFDTLDDVKGVAAAAFDTRQDAPKALTGQASRAIRSRLNACGFHLLAPPESFLVDKTPLLRAGEAERALRWGYRLAELVPSPSIPLPRTRV
jgi:Flavodoxin